MSDVANSLSHAKRRSCRQLFSIDAEHNVKADEVIAGGKHNGQRRGLRAWTTLTAQKFVFIFASMNKSTKTGLIGIAILICVVIVVLLINLQSVQPDPGNSSCIKLNGSTTCHSTDSSPFRYYGTKTTYNVATPNKTVDDFEMGQCIPKVFYLLSRHATRYPDKDNIDEMIERLPILKEAIINASIDGKAKICKEDIEKLKSWQLSLIPENDNKLSPTGEQEAAELAQRYKERFPTILGKDYSTKDFIIEYTSRERTRSTAESFAKGLFGDQSSKSIDFNGKTNDKVLQFHKDCSSLQKRCKDTSRDLEELKKFEKGPFVKSLVHSVSKRLGFKVSYDDIEVMYRACAFGFALENGDIWCTAFSDDDFKVLEYEGDIDDYYKDGYGNKINYEQACPVVNYLVNLLKTSMNKTNSKAVLHFTHAGAIKKVYTRFGLFYDNEPLTADGLCFHQDRKWKSSLISPFNSNLAFVLFQCGDEFKVAAFQNEQQVVLGGCKSVLCPIQDFYMRYDPISENCSVNDLCCSCCVE